MRQWVGKVRVLGRVTRFVAPMVVLAVPACTKQVPSAPTDGGPGSPPPPRTSPDSSAAGPAPEGSRPCLGQSGASCPPGMGCSVTRAELPLAEGRCTPVAVPDATAIAAALAACRGKVDVTSYGHAHAVVLRLPGQIVVLFQAEPRAGLRGDFDAKVILSGDGKRVVDVLAGS